MSEAATDNCALRPTKALRNVWLAAYVLLGGVLLYALVARYFLPLYISEPLTIESSDSEPAAAVDGGAGTAMFDDRIDPNTAGWSELTRLPGIGEVTAKRIVAYREEHRTQPDEPVFRSAADLDRVRGIGPKTVEAIAPMLKFEE